MEAIIQQAVNQALLDEFGKAPGSEGVTVTETRREFEGDFTVVVFPLLRYSGKSPEETARIVGDRLVGALKEVDAYNVVKGFLNLSLGKAYWQHVLNGMHADVRYGYSGERRGRVMVEYSSPNTNKPLHLGHVRNNVLGHAISGMLEASGYEVVRANLINDRGIHICKSMLAWQKWGNGETPESSGMKGDHLVGKYYVAFDRVYKEEIAALVASGQTEEEAKKTAPVLLEAQEMLRRWEAGDPAVVSLWKQLNQWVYDGFEVTYRDLGVHFDKYYYESETYLLGRETVLQGVNDGVFYRRDDGSVWVDLRADGLDEKLLLRADGTSVYMTQDIGTADLKYRDYGMERSIYVVGNEQDYHFKVLKLICRKLDRPYADGIQHLSYGMVELPSGKMKSREGTVVDADDLVAGMIDAARERTQELGKIEGFTEAESEALYRQIGLGALKFFLLKVDAKKNMLFNPAESIDLHGYTGPFVQYTHARISSILRKSELELPERLPDVAWEPAERELVVTLSKFPAVRGESAAALNPSALVDYAYNLAKAFNKYYAEVTILGAEDRDVRTFRVALSALVARTIRHAFAMVGIEVPERM